MRIDSIRRGQVALLLVMVAAALLPGLAAAADKAIAVVNTLRIREEYQAFKDAEQQVEEVYDDLRKELDEKSRALAIAYENYESQKMLLTPEANEAKVQELEQQKADLNRQQQQSNQRLEQATREHIGPIEDQILTIAERIAKEDDYALVIDVSAMAVLYVDSDVDITDQVLAALARGDDD
jgi:Skp family chaperone for outer membrane proteins